ncbi:response regulator [Streptomyces tauricus]|uniref:response regulator n=1 Tax=Streptomyces tauricus TaxID=68274 RepID=UPI00387EE8D5
MHHPRPARRRHHRAGNPAVPTARHSHPAGAMNTRPITVLIAEDHPVFLDGLAARLSATEDMRVVATVCTGLQAAQAALEHSPDVAVLDIEMPDQDGIETTRQLHRLEPPVRVLILTVHEDDQRLTAAMHAGALGYLSKHAEPATILEAVRTVARGAMFFDPRLSDRIRARLSSDHLQRHPFPQLTDREHQVLALLATNCSNQAIAQRLGISGKTARNHVSAILAKLPAGDRALAGQQARNAGLTLPFH